MNMIKMIKIITTIILILAILTGLYIMLFKKNKKCEQFENPYKSDEDLIKYSNLTMENKTLIMCLGKVYEIKSKTRIRSYKELIDKGLFIEFPKEYVTSKIGSNKLHKRNPYCSGQNSGWIENESTYEGLVIYPVNSYLEISLTTEMKDCEKWLNRNAEMKYKSIINIRRARKLKIIK